jgi:hypothetical protein
LNDGLLLGRTQMIITNKSTWEINNCKCICMLISIFSANKNSGFPGENENHWHR